MVNDCDLVVPPQANRIVLLPVRMLGQRVKCQNILRQRNQMNKRILSNTKFKPEAGHSS